MKHEDEQGSARIEREGDTTIKTSWMGRSWQFAGALSSMVRASKARSHAGAPSLQGGAVEYARAFVESVGHLKGGMLKVGQLLSYIDPTLSDEEQSVMAQLQDRVPPMPAEVVERLVEAEWRRPISEAVEHWEREPLAAASIGQVHRARLAGGRLVAVKVQYPDIVKALKADLKTLGVLGTLGGIALPGRDTAGVAAEVEARLLEECDYELEARNQEEFGRMFRDVPEIAIPEVVRSHSTRRVLATEFFEAMRFHVFARSASAAARNRAGLAIARFAFESIFRHGLFNCDPHPGNYLFQPDGRVVFLDFGCVKRFSAASISTWKKMMRAGLEGDRARFDDSVVELGLIPRGGKFDFDYHYEMFRCVSRPWLCEEFQYDQSYIRESNRVLIRDNPNRARLRLPRDFVFVNRLQWGLNSVLASLNARGRFREQVLPWIYDMETRPTVAAAGADGALCEVGEPSL